MLSLMVLSVLALPVSGAISSQGTGSCMADGDEGLSLLQTAANLTANRTNLAGLPRHGNAHFGKGVCGGTDWQFPKDRLNAHQHHSSVPRAYTHGTTWYTHPGLATGIANVKSVFDCANVCFAVPGCLYFSVSTTQAIYACLIHKTCTKKQREYDYGIYKLVHASDTTQGACAIAYCNHYPDLKKAFCGGTKCYQFEEARKCHQHWTLHGRGEGRTPDPDACVRPR